MGATGGFLLLDSGRTAYYMNDAGVSHGERKGAPWRVRREEESMQEQIETVAEWISRAKSIVVFVGAGMSTESGIPDFRSPGGVWDKYDPEDFDFGRFLTNEKSRQTYWQMATEMYDAMRDAEPNAGHLAIAEMERMGKLDCLITQNIDGLHYKAGNSETKVLELHGTAMHVTCLSCHMRYDREPVQARIAKGEKAPVCLSCGGLLKPATISFGQAMPQHETAEAYRRSELSDLFIVVGSSLVVHPAASMPVVAKRSGAKLVIINRDETACDTIADLVIHGQAGETMAAILARVAFLNQV
jgi:NAD-dependent deacetylase